MRAGILLTALSETVDLSELPPRDSRWRLANIEGTRVGEGVLLNDLDSGAQLIVTGGRLARGTGYQDAARSSRYALARTGAILRLRLKNRYYLHASGVVDGEGNAFVFVGESGAGKSTLAFALVRQGWSLLGDDGVVLELTPNGVLAHGWRAPLLVSVDLERFFPEMRGRAQGALEGDVRRRVPVDAGSAARAPLAALVFVEQGTPGWLRSYSESEAMMSLVRQSPWVLLADESSAAHFSALRDVVRTTPLFDFRHGPAELERVGEIFHRSF